jgi:hypothetical protein
LRRKIPAEKLLERGALFPGVAKSTRWLIKVTYSVIGLCPLCQLILSIPTHTKLAKLNRDFTATYVSEKHPQHRALFSPMIF